MALQIQKAIAVALISFTLMPLPAFAQEGCEPFQDIPINVKPVFDEPNYDYSQGIPEIQNLARDANHSIREGIVLGLAHYEPMVEFSTPVETVTYPEGISCAHVVKVDVTFGYRDVTVYVAHEIPQGSCGFDEVLAHEQKHIAVNREILDKYVPVIRQRLAEYLRLNGMFREENRDYALSLIKVKLGDILNDLGTQIMQENQDRQKEVDSPQEYRRLSEVCNGQLAGVALRARQQGQR